MKEKIIDFIKRAWTYIPKTWILIIISIIITSLIFNLYTETISLISLIIAMAAIIIKKRKHEKNKNT